MPFPFPIVVLVIVGILGIIMFIGAIAERSLGMFGIFVLCFVVAFITITWMNLSANNLEQNPKILKTEICRLISEKQNDGSIKQYVLTKDDLLINITKKTGKYYPEGTSVRLDWYERIRYGIHWEDGTNTENRKDPILSFDSPTASLKAETEK